MENTNSPKTRTRRWKQSTTNTTQEKTAEKRKRGGVQQKSDATSGHQSTNEKKPKLCRKKRSKNEDQHDTKTSNEVGNDKSTKSTAGIEVPDPTAKIVPIFGKKHQTIVHDVSIPTTENACHADKEESSIQREQSGGEGKEDVYSSHKSAQNSEFQGDSNDRSLRVPVTLSHVKQPVEMFKDEICDLHTDDKNKECKLQFDNSGRISNEHSQGTVQDGCDLEGPEDERKLCCGVKNTDDGCDGKTGACIVEEVSTNSDVNIAGITEKSSKIRKECFQEEIALLASDETGVSVNNYNDSSSPNESLPIESQASTVQKSDVLVLKKPHIMSSPPDDSFKIPQAAQSVNCIPNPCASNVADVEESTLLINQEGCNKLSNTCDVESSLTKQKEEAELNLSYNKSKGNETEFLHSEMHSNSTMSIIKLQVDTHDSGFSTPTPPVNFTSTRDKDDVKVDSSVFNSLKPALDEIEKKVTCDNNFTTVSCNLTKDKNDSTVDNPSLYGDDTQEFVVNEAESAIPAYNSADYPDPKLPTQVNKDRESDGTEVLSGNKPVGTVQFIESKSNENPSEEDVTFTSPPDQAGATTADYLKTSIPCEEKTHSVPKRGSDLEEQFTPCSRLEDQSGSNEAERLVSDMMEFTDSQMIEMEEQCLLHDQREIHSFSAAGSSDVPDKHKDGHQCQEKGTQTVSHLMETEDSTSVVQGMIRELKTLNKTVLDMKKQIENFRRHRRITSQTSNTNQQSRSSASNLIQKPLYMNK